MADERDRGGPPPRAGLIAAFVGLGILVLVVDWVLGAIFG